MKTKTICPIFWMIFISTIQIVAQNTNPVVSAVTFSISGTTVTVTYNVTDAEQNIVTIFMKVSNDGGTTWNYDYGVTSPTLPASVSIGNGKTITWTYEGTYNSNFKIRIYANDETVDGSPCPGITTVDYGGKRYSTIQIGTQCWLKENLDIGTRIDGNGNQTNNSPTNVIEKYCYDNVDANCDTYGGFYQWDEAMKYVTNEGTQGICPDGFHIPTYAESQTLATAVRLSSNPLKAIGQGTDVGTGTNTSGFSSLLAGYRSTNNTFLNSGYYAYFWSSTEYDANYAYDMFFWYADGYVYFNYNTKGYGFSVRCLKD